MTSIDARVTIEPRTMRARLEGAIRQLAARTAGGTDAMALAEAHFRLAVLPGTESSEALAHLRAAVALDSLPPQAPLPSRPRPPQKR